MIIAGLLTLMAIIGITAFIAYGVKNYESFESIFSKCFFSFLIPVFIILLTSFLSSDSYSNPTIINTPYFELSVKVGQQNLRYSLLSKDLIEVDYIYNPNLEISPTGKKYFTKISYHAYWGLWVLHLPAETYYTIYVTEQDYQRLLNAVMEKNK